MFNIIRAAIGAGRALGIGEGRTEDEESEIVTKEVRSHGIEGADKVRVKVQGKKVVVEGDGIDQDAKEKILMAAGNIKGIGEVEDKIIAAKKAAAAGQFHQVEPGDTLSKIAQKHYGKANAYPEIFEANKPMLSHPDKIYPGQILRVPPKK